MINIYLFSLLLKGLVGGSGGLEEGVVGEVRVCSISEVFIFLCKRKNKVDKLLIITSF